ncbi:MAG: glycosyltransferase, partial [Chitinophagaceae bacterium]
MNVLESVLWYLFLAVQLILAIYLLIPTLLLCLYAICKGLKLKTPFQRKRITSDKNFEFGIIITAHQETKFIFPLVDSVLKQTYPNYQVYVVADDCDISDLKFNDSRITILRPEPPLNAKIKSIHYAIDNFIRKHDAVIIFDADNLIHPRFLEVMNAHFQKGYRVVQADFKPKNTDSHYARMDAIGDMFNFFVEREARMVLNLSAAIWG